MAFNLINIIIINKINVFNHKSINYKIHNIAKTIFNKNLSKLMILF